MFPEGSRRLSSGPPPSLGSFEFTFDLSTVQRVSRMPGCGVMVSNRDACEADSRRKSRGEAPGVRVKSLLKGVGVD